jgi:hypothetical protein
LLSVSAAKTGGTGHMPPTRNDQLYVQLLRMIEENQEEAVIEKILKLNDKHEQVYAVSRLYKGIYPHLDKVGKLSVETELHKILKTIEANGFLFDLSLSIIEETDLNLDIRSDLQHANTLKRMIAHAFKEAIDLDYELDDPLMLELDKVRSILQTIINTLKQIVQSSS